jgi:hypothetical protein
MAADADRLHEERTLSEVRTEPVVEPPITVEQPTLPATPVAAPETPPVATDAVPVETPADAPPQAPPEPEGTLLATEPPKTEGEEQKPEEAPKVEEPPPVEEIKYEFQLPEGVEIPEERAEPLTKWLGTHKIPAEDAQALMDMHTSAMKEYADHLVAEQWRVFNEMNAKKRTEIMADPVLGGAAYETNKNAARRMIDLFVPPSRAAAFNERMKAGGMLDDIEFMSMMVNIARKFGEPSPPPPNPAPVPNGAGRPPRGGGSMYTYPRGGNSG